MLFVELAWNHTESWTSRQSFIQKPNSFMYRSQHAIHSIIRHMVDVHESQQAVSPSLPKRHRGLNQYKMMLMLFFFWCDCNKLLYVTGSTPCNNKYKQFCKTFTMYKIFPNLPDPPVNTECTKQAPKLWQTVAVQDPLPHCDSLSSDSYRLYSRSNEPLKQNVWSSI